MFYRSTRNSSLKKSSAEAIVAGISEEGGLFVPDEIPSVTPDEIKALDSELKAVYKKVMSNPRMMVFPGAQQALEKLVTNMQQIIQLCANGEDPDTCQIPEAGCSGSCASCAGCH